MLICTARARRAAMRQNRRVTRARSQGGRLGIVLTDSGLRKVFHTFRQFRAVNDLLLNLAHGGGEPVAMFKTALLCGKGDHVGRQPRRFPDDGQHVAHVVRGRGQQAAHALHILHERTSPEDRAAAVMASSSVAKATGFVRHMKAPATGSCPLSSTA